MNIEALRFPLGQFEMIENPTEVDRKKWIKTIDDFPYKIAIEAEGLGLEQAAWRYRPDGWTIQQVIHHCADSHMNSIIRFKLALTEDKPTIKPYNETAWAELKDSQAHDVEDSLMLISGLHSRWVTLLQNIEEPQWNRTVLHPEHDKAIDLNKLLAIYDWHCRHHLEHVRLAKKNKY
ncbi:MAG: hypothetical protein ACI959_001250 [Limisphaerales bacterium]|jgi:hypothetical protein